MKTSDDWDSLESCEQLAWVQARAIAADRAALAEADGPAVPEGREPASVTGKPSDQDLYDYWISTSPELGCADPVGFARAVLARWGTPNQAEIRSSLGDAPTPVPLEGEVGELISVIESCAGFTDESTLVGEVWAKIVALLEQISAAAPAVVPVPVSERLPGPKDRNKNGECWWFCFECPGEHSYWILAKEVYCDPAYWLPAHALPLPAGEGE